MMEEPSNAHADATLQMLQDAEEEEGVDASGAIEDLTSDRDTFECTACGRLFVRRGKALQCCSDEGTGGDDK